MLLGCGFAFLAPLLPEDVVGQSVRLQLRSEVFLPCWAPTLGHSVMKISRQASILPANRCCNTILLR